MLCQAGELRALTELIDAAPDRGAAIVVLGEPGMESRP
jgi:hypothetical protein